MLPIVHVSAYNIVVGEDAVATGTDLADDTSRTTKNDLFTSDAQNVKASQITHESLEAHLARSEVHYLNAIIIGALTNYNILETLRSSLSKSTLLSVLVEQLLAPLFFAKHQSTIMCDKESTALRVSSSAITTTATSSTSHANIPHASSENDIDINCKPHNTAIIYTNNQNDDAVINNTAETEKVKWNSICSFCPLIMNTYADIKQCCFYHGEAFPVLLTFSPWNIDETVNFPVVVPSSSSLEPEGVYNSASIFHETKSMLTSAVVEAIISHTLELLQKYPERVCNPFWCKVDAHGNVYFNELSPTIYREVYMTETTVNAQGNSSVLSICKPLDEERVESTLEDLERQYNTIHYHQEQNTNNVTNSSKLNKNEEVSASYQGKEEVEVIKEISAPVEYSLPNDSIIQLDSLAQCHVLILGTGTLGCNVARNLIMWGVRHITLYDRGSVSFSNLARQSLFTFSDAKVGRCKVEAAAEALRRILPSIHVNAVHGIICMPGHRLQESSFINNQHETHQYNMQSKEQTQQQQRQLMQQEVSRSETLENESNKPLQENSTLQYSENVHEHAVKELLELTALMKSHDVVFLLTDSREARWVPSVIAASEEITIINVALGFDTFVVMRHGIRHVPFSTVKYNNKKENNIQTHNVNEEGIDSTSSENNCCSEKEIMETEEGQNELELGCYFCADVVAPRDSMSMRALDQQCTVTRPGVSNMASAIAVELLASIYQHPQRFHCPAYHTKIRKNSSNNNIIVSNSTPSTEHADDKREKLGESRLGIIPQQIRGNVFNYSLSHLVGERNRCCTACSDGTIAAYRANPVEFIMKCVHDPLHIEEVCGIKALKSQ